MPRKISERDYVVIKYNDGGIRLVVLKDNTVTLNGYDTNMGNTLRCINNDGILSISNIGHINSLMEYLQNKEIENKEEVVSEIIERWGDKFLEILDKADFAVKNEEMSLGQRFFMKPMFGSYSF